MNEKSFSCKVRNQLVEISFIESLLYVNYSKIKTQRKIISNVKEIL